MMKAEMIGHGWMDEQRVVCKQTDWLMAVMVLLCVLVVNVNGFWINIHPFAREMNSHVVISALCQ